MPNDQLDRTPPASSDDYNLQDVNRYKKTPSSNDPEEAKLRSLNMSSLEEDFSADEPGFGQVAPQYNERNNLRSVNQPSLRNDITDQALKRLNARYQNQANKGIPESNIDLHYTPQGPLTPNKKVHRAANALQTAQDIHEQGVADYAKNKLKEKATKKIKQEVAKQGVKLAARLGLKAAAGAATGGVGAAVLQAGEWALDGLSKLNTAKNRRRIMYVLLFLIFTALFLPFVFAPANKARVDHNGPDPAGGTRTRPETDTYAAGIGGQQNGLVMAGSIETIDMVIPKLKALIEKNPPKGANTGEAQRLIGELQKMSDELRVAGISPDKTIRAQATTKYRKLVTDFYKALYPGRTAAQAEVLSLVNSKRISTPYAVCSPIRDINNLAVQENTLKVITAAANYKSISINCLVTGHRKFVGKPPEQGYPRCGEPGQVSGASQSKHCVGLGIDFPVDNDLLAFLLKNKDALNIDKAFIEAGNHIHVEVNP